MRALRALIAVGLAALVLPAVAAAGNYPPPSDPGEGPAGGRGKGQTFVVCKKKACRYKTIGAAVKKADGKDTIRVRPGTYRENVKVEGPRYDGLEIIGNPRKPRRVKLDGKRLRGAKAQNGIFVNNADRVVVRGIHGRNWKGNCFFVVNVDGYTLDKLVAERCGVYGIYAFNSKGGRMTNSEAFYNNDAGFYIGQTPPQTGRKKRSIVRNIKSWGNVLGWSGTNMRYVTITKSRFYNNGAGIVPNALESEKFPPAEENVIADNDVFWNNFNFYWGAPFEIPQSGAAGLAGYPIGTGILLFGSQDTTIENNRIFGNWLAGLGLVPQFTLAGNPDPELAEAAILRNNVVRGNSFGLEGSDLNGRDMVYDGSGTGNCFADNETRSPNIPAAGGTFAPCPGPADNTDDLSVLAEIAPWIGGTVDKPESWETYWLKHQHAPQRGIRPLERFEQ